MRSVAMGTGRGVREWRLVQDTKVFLETFTDYSSIGVVESWLLHHMWHCKLGQVP